jgi:hypothetical protein
MPDRNDRDVPRGTMPPDPEQARRRFAAARADGHAVRELYLLELAVRASDDDSARRLELYADEAYRDAEAIRKEHELES